MRDWQNHDRNWKQPKDKQQSTIHYRKKLKTDNLIIYFILFSYFSTHILWLYKYVIILIINNFIIIIIYDFRLLVYLDCARSMCLLTMYVPDWTQNSLTFFSDPWFYWLEFWVQQLVLLPRLQAVSLLQNYI